MFYPKKKHQKEVRTTLDVATKADLISRNLLEFHTVMIVQQNITTPSVQTLGGHSEKHVSVLLAKDLLRRGGT